MNEHPTLQINRGTTAAADERQAVAEIRGQIHQEQEQLVLFFCSAAYDLDRLAAELRAAFTAPTIGCTTAGQMGPDGFAKGGITAISLAGGLQALPYAVELAAFEDCVTSIATDVTTRLQAEPGSHPFGLLLVDGLSRMEERLASALYQHLPHVPMVGGSAGDDLTFRQTHVFVNGAFRSNAAVFTLFRTGRPFTTFKFEHFIPTDRTAVVTASDPDLRVVREINGEPAVEAYAQLLGVETDRLDSQIFSNNPFVLELGGEQYLRSIARANPDKSLTLFCAIENGVVLTIGRAVDPAQAATAAFQRVRDELGEPALIIGCDCILRRLEFESSGLLGTIGGILSANNVIGFSTYGEQFNGIHVNQTFTGIAIGK